MQQPYGGAYPCPLNILVLYLNFFCSVHPPSSLRFALTRKVKANQKSTQYEYLIKCLERLVLQISGVTPLWCLVCWLTSLATYLAPTMMATELGENNLQCTMRYPMEIDILEVHKSKNSLHAHFILRNSASSFHWLSSSIFTYCLFVVVPHR